MGVNKRTRIEYWLTIGVTLAVGLCAGAYVLPHILGSKVLLVAIFVVLAHFLAMLYWPERFHPRWPRGKSPESQEE